MIEIIKALMEAVVTGIPGIRTAKREKKYRKLGVDLFLLYVKLNEVTVNAEAIIHYLEEFATRTEQEIAEAEGWPDSTFRYLVRQQEQALHNVMSLFQSQSTLIQILQPQSYNELLPLLSGKSGALRSLTYILGTERFPLDPSQADVDEWREPSQSHHRRRHDFPDRMLTGGPELNSLIFGQSRHWEETALPTRGWDVNTRTQIVQYLEQRQPRQQLEKIKSALTLLRTTLMENFTVADILLEVRR